MAKLFWTAAASVLLLGLVLFAADRTVTPSRTVSSETMPVQDGGPIADAVAEQPAASTAAADAAASSTPAEPLHKTEAAFRGVMQSARPHLKIEPPPALPPAPSSTAVLTAPPSADTVPPAAEPPPAPTLPPLDEEAILRAVVKIECPSEDRKGKYVGSGFLLPKGVVVTAGHLLMDSGGETCQVIFPKDRHPAHYLNGIIKEDRAEIKRRHDEEGIDVAVMYMPRLSAYPEARAIFPERYPYVPYPICDTPAVRGDKLLHFGYPSSFLNQSYLAKAEGEAVLYADIKGIKEQLTEDQTSLFKTPIFGYTNDQQNFHPYLVSRVGTFYGDSGGLAFDATKQCILGPHRGGIIGGGAGENFSVFPVLGWQGAKLVLPQ